MKYNLLGVLRMNIEKSFQNLTKEKKAIFSSEMTSFEFLKF